MPHFSGWPWGTPLIVPQAPGFQGGNSCSSGGDSALRPDATWLRLQETGPGTRAERKEADTEGSAASDAQIRGIQQRQGPEETGMGPVPAAVGGGWTASGTGLLSGATNMLWDQTEVMLGSDTLLIHIAPNRTLK